MRPEQWLPCASLALNVGCASGYLWAGEWPKMTYWTGAAIINVALLFM